MHNNISTFYVRLPNTRSFFFFSLDIVANQTGLIYRIEYGWLEELRNEMFAEKKTV